MKQVAIKRLIYTVAIPAVFLVGWAANHPRPVPLSPQHQVLISDPAFGATANAITYNPESFRADIKRLVDIGDYSTAIALLDAAYIDEQIAHDGGDQYYAVAGYAISLPGAEKTFDRDRDWIFPGTGCAIQSFSWAQRTTRFAKAYNSRRDAQENGG